MKTRKRVLRRPASPWSSPMPVTIEGWYGQVKEPAAAKDGSLLFFNSPSALGQDNLHMARYIDMTHWAYVGLVPGVNTTAFQGAAEMAIDGTLFYASTQAVRSSGSWCTMYANGMPLVGICKDVGGWVDVDPAVALASDRIVYAHAQLNPDGPFYKKSNLVGAVRLANGEWIPAGGAEFALINTSTAREYAPAVTPDWLTLFFTREYRGKTKIMVSTRSKATERFGKPVDVVTDHPQQEAPSIFQNRLYYHAATPAGMRCFVKALNAEGV